ncbi:MAG: tetratricopeptide repeat protein [candidate division KSB1 bacterium]|nr:tetratricopeptide repeat protein [candidate division KSB1 bacterium]
MPFIAFENSDIDWLKRKVEQNPASIFHARLADYYLRQKDYDRALEHAQKSVVQHPDYPSAHWVLAKCYYERQEYDKANKSLQDLLRLDPQHPAALKLSCELMKQVGDLYKAKEYLRRILEIDPADKDIAKQLAGEEERVEPMDRVASPTTTETPAPSMPAARIDESQEPQAPPAATAEETQEQTSETQWDISQFDFLNVETVPGAPTPEPSTWPAIEVTPTPGAEETPAAAPQNLDWLFDTQQAAQQPEVPVEEDGSVELQSAFPESEAEESAPTPPIEEMHPVQDDFDINWDSIPQDLNLQHETRQFDEMLEEIFRSDLDVEEQQEKQEHTMIQNAAYEPETAEENPIEFSFEEPFTEAGAPTDAESQLSYQEPFFTDAQTPAAETDQAEKPGPDFFKQIFGTAKPKQNEPISAEPYAPTSPVDKDERPSRTIDIKDVLAGLDIRDDAILQEAPQKEAVKPPEEPSRPEIQRPPLADEEEYPPAEEAEADKTHADHGVDSRSEPEEEKSGRRASTKFITPTLGEIYASQGQYAKAIGVYENLLKNDPQNIVYRQKLEWLRQKLQEQQLSGLQ